MCNCIADCHEHTAEVALVKFGTIFLPELSEDPLGVGDDRWSSCPGGGGQSPPRDSQLCLECSDPHGPP